MQEMLYVFLFTFSSLPLIFTPRWPHFLTAAIKLSSYEVGLLPLFLLFFFLSLALALSLLSTLMLTLELSRKKESALLLLLFFYL